MRSIALLLLIGLLFASCATELNETQSGALLGSGLGAGLGAIVGNQTGHAGAGTAIGAGTGLLAGALVGEGMRRQSQKIDQLAAQQQYAPQSAPAPAGRTQEVHTKYNPRTGETFPDRFQYDPKTGEELLPLR